MRKLSDRFEEVVLAPRNIGLCKLQNPLVTRKLLRNSDAAIAMFDLAWLNYIVPVLIKPSCRYILWGHRYGANDGANSVRDFIMRRADALLMYGDEHHARMINAGIDPQRIFIAPNTMAVKPHQDFSSHQKSSILFVGRLQKRKRLDLALRAFERIKDEIALNIVFDIVGDGPPKHELVALAHQLGIADRVKFHGAINDDDILARLFATAFTYVSPGPVGLSVLHSFSFGVPVLTLREGRHGPEFHNLTSGVNSVIVDLEANFPDALRAILMDNGSAQRMGGRAYAHYRDNRTIVQMIAGFRAAIEDNSLMFRRRGD